MSVKFSSLQCYPDLSHECTTNWSFWDLGGNLFVSSVLQVFDMFIRIRFKQVWVCGEPRSSLGYCFELLPLCHLPVLHSSFLSSFWFSNTAIAVCLWPSGRRTERMPKTKNNEIWPYLHGIPAPLNGEESSSPLEVWFLQATIAAVIIAIHHHHHRRIAWRVKENEENGEGKLKNLITDRSRASLTIFLSQNCPYCSWHLYEF